MNEAPDVDRTAPPPDVTVAPPVAWGPSSKDRLAVPGAPGVYFASTLTRYAAYLIDSLLVAVLAFAAEFVIGAALGVGLIIGGQDEHLLDASYDALGVGVAIAVSLAYFVLSWTTRGRATPAQRMFGIQVGRAFDGQPLGRRQAAIRWAALGNVLDVLYIVPVLAGPALVIRSIWSLVLLVSTVRSTTKQGLHDRWAQSAVVAFRAGTSGAAITCLILVLVLPVLAVVGIIALIFLGTQISQILNDVGTQLQ